MPLDRLLGRCFRAVGHQVPMVLAIALGTVLGQPTITDAVPTVTAGSATVDVGDIFGIPVSVTDAVDLTFWQFDLSFDPAILHANSVAEGPFLSSFCTTLDPCTVFSPGVIDDAIGLISLVTNSYADLPPNPSADGELAVIEFEALAPGVSPLTLSKLFLNLGGQGFDVVNGEVTVRSPVTVPEPSSVALLAAGVAALGARRLWRRLTARLLCLARWRRTVKGGKKGGEGAVVGPLGDMGPRPQGARET